MEEYNPNSTPALLATILARLDAQEQRHDERIEGLRALMEEIKVQTTLTNGRVTKVEKWRDSYVARASGIALAASMGAAGVAWVVNLLFSGK